MPRDGPRGPPYGVGSLLSLLKTALTVTPLVASLVVGLTLFDEWFREQQKLEDFLKKVSLESWAVNVSLNVVYNTRSNT